MGMNDNITKAEHLDEQKAAFYDSYDYNTFWHGRDYEHEAESITILDFLEKSKAKRGTIVDVGGGLGRLAPHYAPLYKEAVLLDPSVMQLEETKKAIGEKYPNLSFIRGIAERLPFKDNSVDALVCVRVSHHIPNFYEAISEFMRVLTPGGYLTLEIANKLNIKSRAKAVFKNETQKLHSSEPIEVPTQKNNKTTPFVNHNPNVIKKQLIKSGFQVISMRSASNFRSPFLKKVIPIPILLFFEKMLQKSLASVWFGPSIFFLAKKNK